MHMAYNNKIIASIFLIFILYSWSCKNNQDNDEHPEYFAKILKKVDTAQFGNINKAFAFLDSSLRAFPNTGEGDRFSSDSIKENIFFFVKRDYPKTVAYLDSMLFIAQRRVKEEKYAERYARVLFLKGDYFRYTHQYSLALRHYTLGEEAVFAYVKNKCAITEQGGGMANLMYAQQNYLSAASYFLKYYKDLLSSCSVDNYRHTMDLERSLNDAALSYLQAGVYDSAAYYENAALAIIADNEKRFPANYLYTEYAKGVIYSDQAEVISHTGDPEVAENLFKKSIVITSKYDAPFTQGSRTRLAALYLKQNKTELGKEMLDSVKKSLDTLPNEHHLSQWYELEIKYYIQKKQIKDAFQYNKKYEALKDSLQIRDRNFETKDIGQEFENLNLKYANEALEKDDRLKTFYLLTTALIVFAAAAIVVLIRYNLKRTKKISSQIRKKNDELEKAFLLLEYTHDENTRIMKIVAQDLKTPISMINDTMRSLLQKEQTEDKKEMFEVIQSSCVNSISLIEDLLGKTENQPESNKDLIDIAILLEYCIQLLQAKADEKKQTLKLEAVHANIMANHQKIWRVISNLINNAIKFSPEHTFIHIKLEKKGSRILLSVIDNGIGIPQNMQGQIFNLPKKSARQGTAGEESYGLGLSITKKIVEEHKGKLWFYSIEHKGSAFYVEFPAPVS